MCLERILRRMRFPMNGSIVPDGAGAAGGCAAHGERQCGIYVHTLLGGEGFLGSKEVA